MEFAEGFAEKDETLCRRLSAPFQLIVPDLEIAWRASRISRGLRPSGTPIGDNDLWVAPTALERGMPVVSRNLRRYERVPGLQMVSYSASSSR